MRKVLAVVLAVSIALVGCGQSMSTSQKEYPTYGFFNEGTQKSKDVCYKISVGNVVWAILLFETVVAPIYFIGWSLYNPVRMKKGPNDQCSIDD